MVLWIGFAVLAAAVTWAVMRPLLASRATPVSETNTELAVYRDQLAEIEAERDQGLIAAPEAEAARVEVARRLIRSAEEPDQPSDTAARPPRSHTAALAAAAAVPVLAIGVYLAIGHPMLPGRPHGARLETPIETATASDLIAKVEAHLRRNPDDGRGWDVLAPVYMRMGDFQRAAQAYDRALRLLGDSPKRLRGFARAAIMSENGVVNEPARRTYEKLGKLEPDSIEPQVWLAIAKEQDGDLRGAADVYRALLSAETVEEPWKSLLNQRLAGVMEKLGGDAAAGPDNAQSTAPAPPAASRSGEGAPVAKPLNPDDAAAFHNMSPEQRQAFIEDMVGRLAARLNEDGSDLPGWMQLVRAYVVLGRTEDAKAALERARGNFAGNDEALEQLQILANLLAIGT